MSKRRVLVLNVVGLSADLLRHAPHLSALAAQGGLRPIGPLLPAVTCSVQSTYLTGLPPSEHGIVGNGWYFRDLSEVMLWKQSNRLVSGEKIWDSAKRRDPDFTCAQLFWWYNMHSSADFSVTPRPCYPADGRKIPDIYTQPANLRDELNAKLGQFPLFNFWGPRAGIESSRWIADCALHMLDTRRPSLTLVYLPHLDYDLQRLGPEHPSIPAAVAAVDALCGELIAKAQQDDMAVIVLSEYGITPVTGAVPINRILRQAGLLTVRMELDRELLDPGASEAFAVVDHQIAHVYLRDAERLEEIRTLLVAQPGVEKVLVGAEKAAAGLAHANAGDLVMVSTADRWFSYGWWLDDASAPDYARTVDIHRKPGYDPVELFIDPSIRFPKLAVGWRLAKRALGLRCLLDVIPLDESLVRGSHGRPPDDPTHGPLLISSEPGLLPEGAIAATAVKDVILGHLFSP